MPASRSARAMILAPRSWPSSPGLATTTRIFRSAAVEDTARFYPGRPDGRPSPADRPARRAQKRAGELARSEAAGGAGPLRAIPLARRGRGPAGRGGSAGPGPALPREDRLAPPPLAAEETDERRPLEGRRTDLALGRRRRGAVGQRQLPVERVEREHVAMRLLADRRARPAIAHGLEAVLSLAGAVRDAAGGNPAHARGDVPHRPVREAVRGGVDQRQRERLGPPRHAREVKRRRVIGAGAGEARRDRLAAVKRGAGQPHP